MVNYSGKSRKAPGAPQISIFSTLGIQLKIEKFSKGVAFFLDFQMSLAQKKAPPHRGFSRASTVHGIPPLAVLSLFPTLGAIL